VALSPGEDTTSLPPTKEKKNKMLKQKIAITLAVGSLAAGVGVASALADNSPGVIPTATTAVTTTTPTSTSGEQGDQQNGQEGIEEQGAANDIADAANDVQDEANNTGADDQSGDQQGPNDQSGEQGDNGQSGENG
jgi:hypothetical protein